MPIFSQLYSPWDGHLSKEDNGHFWNGQTNVHLRSALSSEKYLKTEM